tara:strand:- start:87 stop:1271 length:1185 start_codon:yes stop_codon:yes gene_type:complete
MNEVYRNSGLGKWFHSQSAGGKPGWDRYNTKGERVGECGDSKPGEGKPKCLSKQKAAKLRARGGKAEIGKVVRRKKRKDPQQDRPGTGNKPINVSNFDEDIRMKSFTEFLMEENVPTDPDKWAASIAAAKQKFDVYPSAYANAWAARDYKKKGGGWKKKAAKKAAKKANESFELENRSKNQYSGVHPKSKGWKKGKVVTGISGYTQSGRTILHKKGTDLHFHDHGDKIVGASDPKNPNTYFRTGKERIQEEKKNCGCEQDPCITYGTQNEALDSQDKPTLKRIIKKLKGASQAHAGQAKDLEKAMKEDWQKVNRQDKTDGLSQKAVDAYRRENPGSKLKTAVTEKNPKGRRAGRRKSFCSRMCGMKSKLTSAETSRDPDSRINKALRRWNCNCS